MKLVITCFILAILLSCSSSHIITVWKINPVYPTGFKQVLIAATLPEGDSALRTKIENEVGINLRALGYPSISTLDFFGTSGLANWGEEETYIQLCSTGIDYILVIALLNKSQEKYLPGEGSLIYPASQYYNRIRNYRNVQTYKVVDTSAYVFEAILFDLATLQPLLVLRTPVFDNYEKIKISNELTGDLVKKMQKEKILTKQITSNAPRPF